MTVRLCFATLEHDHAWWMLRDAASIPDVQVVGVLDSSTQRAGRLSEVLPGPVAVYTGLDQMLDSEAPDGLIVTAPNDVHGSLLIPALDRGIRCLVQKPLATTWPEALAIQEAARRSGTTLMVNHFPAWRPAHQAFFGTARDGIGTIRTMIARNGHQGPHGISVLTDDYQAWLYDPRRHGGRSLMDQATYGIAWCAWLMGRPLAVVATERPIRHRGTAIDDISTVVLEYEHGVAEIMGSWAWPHRYEELRCLGSEGSVSLIDGSVTHRPAAPTIDSPDASAVLSQTPPADPAMANGVAFFVDHLRTGRRIVEPHTLDSSVLVAQVTDAAHRSAREGRTVLVG